MDHQNMERYRRGHNGAVLKTVRVQAHVGSNPTFSAMLATLHLEAAELLFLICGHTFAKLCLVKRFGEVLKRLKRLPC